MQVTRFAVRCAFGWVAYDGFEAAIVDSASPLEQLRDAEALAEKIFAVFERLKLPAIAGTVRIARSEGEFTWGDWVHQSGPPTKGPK